MFENHPEPGGKYRHNPCGGPRADAPREASMRSADAGGAGRIDQWLCSVRFCKSRSLAAAAANGGRVRLNGVRVKAAHAVRPGDRLQLSLEGRDLELEVLAIP